MEVDTDLAANPSQIVIFILKLFPVACYFSKKVVFQRSPLKAVQYPRASIVNIPHGETEPHLLSKRERVNLVTTKSR